MPINQLSHISTANISKRNSSSTFTREYSQSRCKGGQTFDTTHTTRVETAPGVQCFTPAPAGAPSFPGTEHRGWGGESGIQKGQRAAL